jgi:hypothetical protein
VSPIPLEFLRTAKATAPVHTAAPDIATSDRFYAEAIFVLTGYAANGLLDIIRRATLEEIVAHFKAENRRLNFACSDVRRLDEPMHIILSAQICSAAGFAPLEAYAAAQMNLPLGFQYLSTRALAFRTLQDLQDLQDEGEAGFSESALVQATGAFVRSCLALGLLQEPTVGHGRGQPRILKPSARMTSILRNVAARFDGLMRRECPIWSNDNAPPAHDPILEVQPLSFDSEIEQEAILLAALECGLQLLRHWRLTVLQHLRKTFPGAPHIAAQMFKTLAKGEALQTLTHIWAHSNFLDPQTRKDLNFALPKSPYTAGGLAKALWDRMGGRCPVGLGGLEERQAKIAQVAKEAGILTIGELESQRRFLYPTLACDALMRAWLTPASAALIQLTMRYANLPPPHNR